MNESHTSHVLVEYWPWVKHREVFNVTVWARLVILGNERLIRKVNIRFTKKMVMGALSCFVYAVNV